MKRVPDAREDCYAEVSNPQQILEFMNNHGHWFTKNKNASRAVEVFLIRQGLGYSKIVDMSCGFEATYKLTGYNYQG